MSPYDGTAYSKTLKSELLIIGARILAVADALEAISSHRPYRPALGMDVALKEIETQRGILFDPSVVDSCIRLLKAGQLAE
ncbi:MAG: HD domain-containing phosphohydrolase [Polynucleobacter sp.]